MWTEKERERDWGQRRGSKEATRTSNDLGFKSFCRSRWRPTPFLSRGSRNSCLSFVQGRATNLGLVTEVPIRRLLRGPGREKWDSIGASKSEGMKNEGRCISSSYFEKSTRRIDIHTRLIPRLEKSSQRVLRTYRFRANNKKSRASRVDATGCAE